MKARKLLEVIKKTPDLPPEIREMAEDQLKIAVYRAVLGDTNGRYWQTCIAEQELQTTPVPYATGFPYKREDPETELRSADLKYENLGGPDWQNTVNLVDSTPVPLVVGASHRLKPAFQYMKSRFTSADEIYMRLPNSPDASAPDGPIFACMCLSRFQFQNYATIGRIRDNSHNDCVYELHVCPPGELCKNQCFQRTHNTDFVIVFYLPKLKRRVGVTTFIRESGHAFGQCW